eukprot:COSAG05_NODE_74_length_21769_cov_194.316290_31_plen_369_part_00
MAQSALLGPLCSPASVGMCPRRLEQLALWGEDIVKSGQCPFAMTLVARRGKVVSVAKAGNVELDALCRMHSMTKPVTSVALMMLHDDGAFQLSDPASKFLGPHWAKENMRVLVPGGTPDNYETVPCSVDITVAHLLTHTAGLSYGLNPLDGRPQPSVAAQEANIPLDGIYERMGLTVHSALGFAPLSMDLEQTVEKLAGCPLMYQPGTAWHYSLATDVCGMLIQAISGMTFGEFLRTRLFEPLGMHDSFFQVPAEKASRQAVICRPDWAGSDSPPAPPLPTAMTSFVDISHVEGQDFALPHSYEMGGGGLVSTLHDYAQFALMLGLGGAIPGSSERVLSSNTLEWMVANHLPGGADLAEYLGRLSLPA